MQLLIGALGRDRGTTFQLGEAKKIFEKCRPPWLGDEENFAYYSSMKGSEQLLSSLITLL